MKQSRFKDDDPELIRRCQEGDERAFGDLYHRYKVDVARILSRVVGPTQDLDDLVQKTFIELFKTVHRFRGDSKFSTWLYRVCVNIGLRHLRSLQRERRMVADTPHMDTRPAQPSSDPMRRVAARESIEQVKTALDQLTHKKREVFTLFEVEGFSLAEIAEMVEIPVPTVKSRLYHARREFYGYLDGQGQAPAQVL